MQNFDGPKTEPKVISSALDKARKFMGMSKADLSKILKIDLKDLDSCLNEGIKPDSLKGQVSLLTIQIYRSLFALSGINNKFMKHFLYTENSYFNARPIDVMKSPEGLVRVNDFLNAMSSKN